MRQRLRRCRLLNLSLIIRPPVRPGSPLSFEINPPNYASVSRSNLATHATRELYLQTAKDEDEDEDEDEERAGSFLIIHFPAPR
jgi:hypothetical protein